MNVADFEKRMGTVSDYIDDAKKELASLESEFDSFRSEASDFVSALEKNNEELENKIAELETLVEYYKTNSFAEETRF